MTERNDPGAQTESEIDDALAFADAAQYLSGATYKEAAPSRNYCARRRGRRLLRNQ